MCSDHVSPQQESHRESFDCPSRRVKSVRTVSMHSTEGSREIKRSTTKDRERELWSSSWTREAQVADQCRRASGDEERLCLCIKSDVGISKMLAAERDDTAHLFAILALAVAVTAGSTLNLTLDVIDWPGLAGSGSVTS